MFGPKPTNEVQLDATTARDARKEIHWRWPKFDVDFVGYDEHGEDVFISSVRKTGTKAPVASARRNRSKPPIKFVAVRFR